LKAYIWYKLGLDLVGRVESQNKVAYKPNKTQWVIQVYTTTLSNTVRLSMYI